MNFKPYSGEPENISEEKALGPVIFSRIYKTREKNQKCADQSKVNPADGPQNKRANSEVGLPHTIASNAPGRISIERHSRRRISPSIITLTGSSRRKSMCLAALRKASGCSM